MGDSYTDSMNFNSSLFRSIFNFTKQNGMLDSNSQAYKTVLKTIQAVENTDALEGSVSFSVALDLMKTIDMADDWYKRGNIVGSNLSTTDLGVLGFYLLSCKHLVHAKKKLCQFQAFICEGINYNVEIEENNLCWALTTPVNYVLENERVKLIFLDFEMALRHNIVQSLIRERFSPVAIQLTYPEYSTEHTRYLRNRFKCNIEFGTETSNIVYDLKDVNKLIPSANQQVYHCLDHALLERVSKENEDGRRLASMARRLIFSNMGYFGFSANFIASKLSMSARSLQRQLKEENTSYKEILESCRKEMAPIYIKKGLANKEIARRLGYTETNSFNRAFRHWFGMGVRAYKKSL